MKLLLSALAALAFLAGCQSAVTDAKTPKRNNSASDFANIMNENQARDRYMFSHGNADRP